MHSYRYIAKKLVEFTIFQSKWLLYPFYLKLIWTLIRLCYHFYFDQEVSTNQIVSALHDVDITMVANLVKMIITGSYNSFVDKSHEIQGEKISSSALKVKMSTSLVGVSSIFLLRIFLSMIEYRYQWEETKKMLVIHCVFLVGALVLAIIEYLHSKSELLSAQSEKIDRKH